MNNIAFIKLDILVNDYERQLRARSVVESIFVPKEGIIPQITYQDTWARELYSERGLYNPAWIALDTLESGPNRRVKRPLPGYSNGRSGQRIVGSTPAFLCVQRLTRSLI
jgi:hypothetical protein